jgi:gamma-glutamylputrescine oxidase
MSMQSLDLIDQRISAFRIDCDWVKGYLHVADSPRKARALEAEISGMARDYGFVAELLTGSEVQRHINSPLYHASAFDTTSGHLHPLKYGLGLARALRKVWACGCSSNLRWCPCNAAPA